MPLWSLSNKIKVAKFSSHILGIVICFYYYCEYLESLSLRNIYIKPLLSFFRSAVDEPVISKPFIHGGEAINPTMQFMFIMTKGLYKALEEATGTDQV